MIPETGSKWTGPEGRNVKVCGTKQLGVALKVILRDNDTGNREYVTWEDFSALYKPAKRIGGAS
jgi:hypothetical protein